MKISKAGIELIKSFEGLVLHAYKPVATERYYTIGYGHMGSDVKSNMKITKEDAEELLVKDLAKFEKAVNQYHKIYKFSQAEYDALVSFAYNIGSINQLTAFGTRDKKTIAEKMLLYVNAGGRPLPGLVRRRRAEHDMFIGRML